MRFRLRGRDPERTNGLTAGLPRKCVVAATYVGTGHGVTSTNEPGTTLTCTNDECSCELTINVPCPHGDQYTCACGHPLVSSAARGDQNTVGHRAEEEGIVDQQAALLDEIDEQ